jgi:hypothetical protein
MGLAMPWSTSPNTAAFLRRSRWAAYRRVIATLAWRIMSCTLASGCPAATSHRAVQWRRSCSRMSRTPARAQAARQARQISR